MTTRANAWAALAVLTALNFVNYIDRSILFAVQELIKAEFSVNDKDIGFLTSAFFICYMVAAPLIAPLADRFPRKYIMAAGAFVWSAATLLTAITHTYDELLLRHIIVGIGEATFVVFSPAYLSDLFPERMRGRVLIHLLSCDSGGHRVRVHHRRPTRRSARLAHAVHDLCGAWCAAGVCGAGFA